MQIDANHQRPRALLKQFTFTDVPLAVEDFVQPPAGAVVTGGWLAVTTAFGSGRTFDLGDTDDPNRLTGSAIDGNTVGVTALTLTGHVYNGTQKISLTRAAGAAPAAGAGVLYVEYAIIGVGELVQGPTPP